MQLLSMPQKAVGAHCKGGLGALVSHKYHAAMLIFLHYLTWFSGRLSQAVPGEKFAPSIDQMN